jgi:hypothetical protein
VGLIRPFVVRLTVVAVVGATTLALANGRLLPAATASASTGATHVLIAARHCGKARGYYKVQARGVSCRRAREVLWHARSGQGSAHGFKCRTVGHGPGGGFPAKTTCRRGGAVASGWVVDNQVSRVGHASGTYSRLKRIVARVLDGGSAAAASHAQVDAPSDRSTFSEGSGAANVRTARSSRCPNFVVFRGHDRSVGSYHYVATRVRRKGHVSCGRVRYMLRGTYYLDRGRVHHYPVGRPGVFYKGGWRCSNGAGGAGCSNVKHRGWSIEADVSYRSG